MKRTDHEAEQMAFIVVVVLVSLLFSVVGSQCEYRVNRVIYDATKGTNP